MGYYDSNIDLSDLLESDNHTAIRALEESAFSWTVDEYPTSEITSASDQHTDTSSRRKKYTKTRVPTPHKPQPIFAPTLHFPSVYY